ncbi:MAG: phenylacetate--CoA ligase family protein [PVC group bacterium]|nr:phenylacetate--CoA ligase family protein [PVC group bacterium]
MNLYERVFFKFCDVLRGRKTIKRLDFLRKSQYWPKEKLAVWQLERLNRLLLKAKTSSSFYKDRLSSVVLPLKDISELQKVPILTKQDIRSNMEKIKCVDEQQKFFVSARTGGSTGEPTHYFLDKRGLDWNRASVYRAAEWAGLNLGECWAQMSGSHFEYDRRQKLYWKLQFLMLNYINLPTAYMSDGVYEQHFALLNKHKPTVIWGYSGGIYNFALFIEKNYPNAKLDFLKALFTSSETMHDYQRLKMNQVFGANKVFDQYGSREMYMASECKQHNGYHLHSEYGLLEVVDTDNKPVGPGKRGRILITNLFNNVFPFIRYEIGDVGVLAEEQNCLCGVTLPKLQKVEGRISDMIVLPDRLLTFTSFTNLRDFEGIEQFQIIQKSRELIEIRIVKNEKFNQESERIFIGNFKELTGEKVELKVRYVAKIDLPESGKRRFIISEIAGKRT